MRAVRIVCLFILYAFLLPANAGPANTGPANAGAETPRAGNRAECNTIEYFYRDGCPHCEKAGFFLDRVQKERPDIIIQPFNVHDRAQGQERFIALINQFDIRQPGVPSFYICDQFLTGFDTADTTGRHILALLAQEKPQPGVAGKSPGDMKLLKNISVEKYGLPLFTILIGLIDGFNPCAMWVLLFLLTLLVNLHSRARILMIAGTFVFISGLVYFAFMAAWLNLFLLIGFSRGLQVLVGLAALIIGTIHVKDYFLFKKGVSLSIPETAKPGIYARTREVIYAENLWASIMAVTILAILVNLVELICTAGLPAAYTRILTLNELSGLEYYSYLLLYNIAYIFDDAMMVAIVVYTLSRTRLQEKAGRFLKLLSGTVIIMLGIFLIFFPGMLI